MEKINSQGFFLKSYGKPEQAFELRDFELTLPNDDEVLIECEAFGLNYADVMARNNMYKEAPPLPAILGYEVVGIVKHIGKSVDPKILNQRVVAFTRFGGYAKHAKTLASAVAPIGNMPAEEALALSTQFVTAYYMTEYANTIHPGDRVLIHAAAGGVGLALIQICKWKEAIVYAKVGNDSKLEFVKELGADYGINYKKDDYEKALQKMLNGHKLDYSFNPVGGSTFKKDMRLLGAGGKMVLFGGSELSGRKWKMLSTLNFAREMGIVVPIFMMMQSKSILGVNMLKIGDRRPEILTKCLNESVKLYESGIVKPFVAAQFFAEDLSNAHSLLESGESMGKVSVFWKS